jgi:hypothetical protein
LQNVIRLKYFYLKPANPAGFFIFGILKKDTELPRRIQNNKLGTNEKTSYSPYVCSDFGWPV